MIVLGRNNDDKGAQLEELARRLLALCKGPQSIEIAAPLRRLARLYDRRPRFRRQRIETGGGDAIGRHSGRIARSRPSRS